MENAYNRRKFLKSASVAGLGFGLVGVTSAMAKGPASLLADNRAAAGKNGEEFTER